MKTKFMGAVLAAVFLSMAAACSGESTGGSGGSADEDCTPKDQKACVCPGGSGVAGHKTCDADGVYGECDCP